MRKTRRSFRGAALALEERVLLTISAGDAFVVEPAVGDAQMVFTLTRTGDLNHELRVEYATEAGTATPGVDYVEQSGIALFQAGHSTTTVSVKILRDNTVENSETFQLKLGKIIADPMFGPASNLAAPTHPQSPVIADMNADGKLDIVVDRISSNQVSVFRNRTVDGNSVADFAPSQDFAVPLAPGAVVVADFNGDGRPDVAASRLYGNDMVVLLNTTTAGSETISFSDPVAFPVGNSPFAIKTADMNGDGKLDIVSIANPDQVVVLLNTTPTNATTPTFAAAQSFSGPADKPRSLTISDFNGDGRPDLASSDNYGNMVSVLLNTTTAGSATMTFAPKLDLTVGDLAHFADSGDLNGDGKADLVVSSFNDLTVAIFTNSPAGGSGGVMTGLGLGTTSEANEVGFSSPLILHTEKRPEGVLIQDVTGDGRPDLIVTQTTPAGQTVIVYRNLTPSPGSAPVFDSGTSLHVANGPNDVAAGDLNRDGMPDLVVTAGPGNSVSVLLNRLEAIGDGVALGTINDRPQISGFTDPVNYVKGFPARRLDLDVTLTDLDTENYEGGQLTVRITANGEPTDRLLPVNSGAGEEQVVVSGNTVLVGGFSIASFTGGEGGTPLVFSFNDEATPNRVQSLLRAVAFRSISTNPALNTRTVEVVLTDGDGGTSNRTSKSVTVVAQNSGPVLAAWDTTVTYVEPTTALPTQPVVLDSNATVVDLDAADLYGGKLTVKVETHVEATDRLSIKHVGDGPNQIGVAGNSVKFGGTVIGTFAGTTTLVVTLNANSTPAAVQALLRSITFSSVSDNPSALFRTVTAQLTDGDGGTSNLVTKTVNVTPKNDAPVLGAWDTTVTYIEPTIAVPTQPVVIDSNATLVDPDSANLENGKLTIKVADNAQSTDRLSIKHVGDGANQIGVDGSSVKFGGTVIGTFAGTTMLVVTLNANATPAAAQALLRSITFSSTSDNPSNLSRTVTAQLTDGDGGTSNVVTKTVNVTPRNDAPVLGAWDATVTYIEPTIAVPTQPVVIDSNATVIDADSANLENGKLTIKVAVNAQTTDRLSIKHVGDGANQIGVDGSSVKFGGTVIGTFAGTTTLVVTLNANATPAAAQALLRSITFSSTSDNPSNLPRTITAQLTDGDGGTSNLVTKTVNVTPRNDAPVLGFRDGSTAYRGTAVLVDGGATATDPDSADFDDGLLTVRVAVNAQSTDRLEIRHQGTGAGQIGISGNQVLFGGVAIGTFAGTTTLTVQLNGDATAAAIQALLRNLTFRSTSATPSPLARTITAQLTDGDGGFSIPVARTITMV